MPLHMIKLCVGAESVEDLQSWVTHRLDEAAREGRAQEQFHQTRMMPKRIDEVLDGGSLYWVIKGRVQVRQPILALRPIVDAERPERCAIFARDQCVAFSGVLSKVATTTSSTCSAVIVAGRPGRGSSQSPSRRNSQNRLRHFPTVGADTPHRRATSVLA